MVSIDPCAVHIAALHPYEFRACGLAPKLTNVWHTSALACHAAKWNGVVPNRSSSFVYTLMFRKLYIAHTICSFGIDVTLAIIDEPFDNIDMAIASSLETLYS